MDNLTRDQKFDKMYDVLVGSPEFGQTGMVEDVKDLKMRVRKMERWVNQGRWFSKGAIAAGGAYGWPYIKAVGIKVMAAISGFYMVSIALTVITWVLK